MYSTASKTSGLAPSTAEIVGGGGKSSSSLLLAVATTLAMAYHKRQQAAESDPTTSQHSQASFSSESSGNDSSANQRGPRTPCVHTPESNSKAERGLPLWVKKKFLQALEENGGLASASVFRVCNSNPEVFGSPKSAVRKQIQNHVSFLKESTQREYYNYLSTLGVVPFAELEHEGKRCHRSAPDQLGVSLPDPVQSAFQQETSCESSRPIPDPAPAFATPPRMPRTSTSNLAVSSVPSSAMSLHR
jgi:hypothetical protein